MSRSILALFLALTASTASTAAANAQTPLTADAINAAVFADWAPETGNTDPDPFLVRVQVLLERIHVSPGVIDGFAGDNLAKAVRLFEETAGLPIDGEVDAAFWDALQTGSAPAVGVYEITQADLESRFVAELPTDYALMAEMDWLGYQGPREMLAERFHMDENLLQALNPDADFSVPGTRIIVADPGSGRKRKCGGSKSAGARDCSWPSTKQTSWSLPIRRLSARPRHPLRPAPTRCARSRWNRPIHIALT